MEDIDLKELFMIFWNKKIQIILFIILFAIIGGIYTIGFIKPMYTASTTLVLATSSGENTQDATNSITTTDVTLNSKLVSTYSELVKAKSIKESNIKFKHWCKRRKLKKKYNSKFSKRHRTNRNNSIKWRTNICHTNSKWNSKCIFRRSKRHIQYKQYTCSRHSRSTKRAIKRKCK